MSLSLNVTSLTEHEFYLNKRIATSCAIVFFLLLVITFINTIYDWVPEQTVDSMNTVIHVSHPTYHLQDISTWHLLGGNPNDGDLPETNLQLTLQGVLTMPNAAQASAIIAQPGQPSKMYSPGDPLPGGAILDKVMVDKVIIRNRGKLEVLPLVRVKLQFAPVPASIW